MSTHLLHHGLTERILGVFFQVHWELGPGFLESVYAGGMGHALRDAGLEIQREQAVLVHFRGHCVGKFRADMIVDSKVLVELKAGDHLDPSCQAQVINYLRATRLEVGLILHFGLRPDFKRLVVTNDRKPLPAKAAAGSP
jgi:GxxExxY protein